MTESDKDEDDVQRLLTLLEDVAEKVCGPVPRYDGEHLSVHPGLVAELAKPENEALALLLDEHPCQVRRCPDGAVTKRRPPR